MEELKIKLNTRKTRKVEKEPTAPKEWTFNLGKWRRQMYLNGNYILVNGTTIKTTNKNIKKDLEKLGYKEDK